LINVIVIIIFIIIFFFSLGRFPVEAFVQPTSSLRSQLRATRFLAAGCPTGKTVENLKHFEPELKLDSLDINGFLSLF
jgi:hypothetical protein